MAEVIVVTSGKGGVGKTTTTANVGAALALMNKRVALLDTDIGLRNLDLVLGLENRIVYDIVNVAEGVCRARQALIKDKRFQGLYLMPAAQSRDKDALTPSGMVSICKEISNDFDYILIDCPAGIEQGFKNAIAAANKAVVVTTPEVSSIRDADRLIGLLDANFIRDHRLIINKVRPDMVKRGDMLSINDIVEILSEDLLGVVPDDENVIIATNRGEPAVLENNALACNAYFNIARRIIGENVPLMLFKKRKENFFQKLLGLESRNKEGII